MLSLTALSRLYPHRHLPLPAIHYNSCSLGLRPVDEGFTAVDSLIEQLCKAPREVPGYKWNSRFESIIDPSDVSRIDIFNSTYEQAQLGEQDFMRDLLYNECDFNYEHLYVFFEYETSCGFEIATNLLIDDGNKLKDMRRVLLSGKMTQVFALHERHVNGPMVTYIVLTTDEITKDEYLKLTLDKVHRASLGGTTTHLDDGEGPPEAEAEVIYNEINGDPTSLSEVHMPPRQSKTPHHHAPTSI